jgi:hypothetical protein
MITGFKTSLAVDDAGTGAAPGGASTKFTGVTTVSLPELTVNTIDGTTLDQDDGGTPTPAPDPYERTHPAGTISVGACQAEMQYTKANYQRLVSLAAAGAGGAEYTFTATTPDDQTSGTPTKLTATFKAFVSKVGAPKFEKGNPVTIPFEFASRKAPSFS